MVDAQLARFNLTEHQHKRVRMLSGGADRTVVGTCTEKIKAAIDVKELKIEGAYDDPNGSHITIYCVSEAFEGKRSLARQQMVLCVKLRSNPKLASLHCT